YALRHIPPLQRHVASHLPEAHEWFERFGKWTLFFGYFIAGVRHFTALVAGTSGLEPEIFAMYAYPGGCLWVACFLTIGYYLGDGWQHISGRFDAIVLAVALLIAVAGFVWWRKNKKQ